MFPHMLRVGLSSPGGRESGHHVDEVSMLGDGIHHDHNGIVTDQFEQLDNEVHAYSVSWGIGNWKGMEFIGGGLTGCLGPQAHVTGRDQCTWTSEATKSSRTLALRF